MKISTNGDVTNIKIGEYDFECNSSTDGELVLAPTERYDNDMEICVIGGSKRSVIKANILFIKILPNQKKKMKHE